MDKLKKVLVLIQSSNQELYTNNTKVIKDIYVRMKDAFAFLKCDFEILSYTAGDKFEVIDDVLYIPCDDQNVYMKHRYLMQYLNDRTDWDFVIKTNATTIVNLSFINAIIENDYYRDTELLTNSLHYIYGRTIAFHYGSGAFLMFSRIFFDSTINNIDKYDDTYICLLQSDFSYMFNKNNNANKWQGVPEDIIWGMMISNIPDKKFVATPGFSVASLFHNNIVTDENNIYDKLSYFTVTSDASYEVRLKLDPILLKLAGQLMIEKPVLAEGFIYYYKYVCTSATKQ